MGGSNQGVISLKKSQILSYSFWFLHQGGQACLVPFFSLYIRQLGMNGAQTGLIIAVSFACSLVALPLWKWVSGRLGQHRMVVFGCLTGSIIFNLFLVAIPPVMPDYAYMYCNGGRLENASWWAEFVAQLNRGNRTNLTMVTPFRQHEDFNMSQNNESAFMSTESTAFSTFSATFAMSTVSTPVEPDIEKRQETRTYGHRKKVVGKNRHYSHYQITTPMKNDNKGATMNSLFKKAQSEDSGNGKFGLNHRYKRTTELTSETYDVDLIGQYEEAEDNTDGNVGSHRPYKKRKIKDKYGDKSYVKNPYRMTTYKNSDPVNMNNKQANKNQEDIDSSLYSKFPRIDLSRDDFSVSALDTDDEEYRLEQSGYQNYPGYVMSRKKRDLFTSAYEEISVQLASFKDQVESFQHRTVLVTVIILIFASVFGCAVSPLFDEAWFEFLDDIDEVELYGRHHFWGGVGKVITPVLAAVIVDGTPCVLSDGKNHMVIHIYLMALFTALSLIVAFLQPVYGKLSKHQPKLFKGVKLLFTDIHCGSLAFTVLIVGVLSSTMHMFMLWVAEDLQSIESPMGLALAIGGTTRLIMMASGKSLVEKLSPAKVVALGLIALAIQLIFVSYMWTPWVLIVTEGLTGLSQGAVWQAVQYHPDFALHLSNTERSVLNILYMGYEGVALPVGCVLSGVVYDHYGASTLFQGAALITVLWCVIFALIQACIPKEKRLQYSELIGATDDDARSISSSTYDFEDDWLEAALKNS